MELCHRKAQGKIKEENDATQIKIMYNKMKTDYNIYTFRGILKQSNKNKVKLFINKYMQIISIHSQIIAWLINPSWLIDV